MAFSNTQEWSLSRNISELRLVSVCVSLCLSHASFSKPCLACCFSFGAYERSRAILQLGRQYESLRDVEAICLSVHLSVCHLDILHMSRGPYVKKFAMGIKHRF